jgi:hypothetical protein
MADGSVFAGKPDSVASLAEHILAHLALAMLGRPS